MNEKIYLCIDCGAETEPLDIPLCPKCAKKYDLKRFWEDHDKEGYPEPWNFIENSVIREEYTIAADRHAKYFLNFTFGDLSVGDKYLLYKKRNKNIRG